MVAAVSPALLAGLALAAIAWGFLFGLGRSGFWVRAAVGGLAIGGYALVALHSLVGDSRIGDLLRPTAPDLALGVAGAAALYVVFWVGAKVLRRWLPTMATEVDQLYALRSIPTSGPLPISLVLLVAGPCEEVFWRGLVQARAGFVVALACYAGVHLWERKAVLVLAAVIGGAFWGALFAWRGTLVAPIVSHALWDLAVVVWFPFAGTGAADVEP